MSPESTSPLDPRNTSHSDGHQLLLVGGAFTAEAPHFQRVAPIATGEGSDSVPTRTSSFHAMTTGRRGRRCSQDDAPPIPVNPLLLMPTVQACGDRAGKVGHRHRGCRSFYEVDAETPFRLSRRQLVHQRPVLRLALALSRGQRRPIVRCPGVRLECQQVSCPSILPCESAVATSTCSSLLRLATQSLVLASMDWCDALGAPAPSPAWGSGVVGVGADLWSAGIPARKGGAMGCCDMEELPCERPPTSSAWLPLRREIGVIPRPPAVFHSTRWR